MTKHKNELNPDHPEVAERVSEPWRVLHEKGLSKRCTVLEVRCLWACECRLTLVNLLSGGSGSARSLYLAQSPVVVCFTLVATPTNLAPICVVWCFCVGRHLCMSELESVLRLLFCEISVILTI